jgi:hypothetical protein
MEHEVLKEIEKEAVKLENSKENSLSHFEWDESEDTSLRWHLS